MSDLLDATNDAIAAARHLTKMDAGAVEALRSLALKIDVADLYFEALADDAVDHNLRPPSQDNVSIPTYLKYAEALGLTPSGRTKAAIDAAKVGDSGGSKVGKFRSVAGGKAS